MRNREWGPVLGAVAVNAVAVMGASACGGGSAMQQHGNAAMQCQGEKNYPCAIEHYTWMIDHGAAEFAIIQRAYVRRDSGDRAGALADANLAVQRSPTMSSYYARGNLLADLDGIAQIGYADANARANPPLDLAAAEADFTSCIGMAPRAPTEVENTSLIMCFKGRRDVRAILGKDSSGDDGSFRRMACDQCNRGVQCFTDSGCTLYMPSSGGGGGGGGSSDTGVGGGAGEAGAWYYSWSCTGECSPGQLAIKGTEGPFPTEDGCNAVRNGDSRKQLVQQPGNVGSVGFCERR